MQFIAIPLPFSAALLAGIVATRVLILDHRRGGLFIGMFFALLAVQGLLAGMKFGYSISLAVYLQPVLAMLAGPLAYLAFRALQGSDSYANGSADLIHLIAPGVVAAIQWFNLNIPVPVDALIWCSFVVYALLLLRMAMEGPDAFQDFNTDDMRTLTGAQLITAFILILISSIDALIYFDLTYRQGSNTGLLLSAGSLLLMVVSIGALLLPANIYLNFPGPLRRSRTGQGSCLATTEDKNVLIRLDRMMMETKPFLDANLNLARTGRRLNLPARSISVAVNRCLGQNFSQYVNHHRIREACRLLEETDLPVTGILYEAGFQTKSNFNREFRRTTGVSPSDYRNSRKANSSA